MRRVAVYGQDSNEKKVIVKELEALKRYKLMEATLSMPSFLLFNDGREPPYYTASLQILVLNLNNETTESIASLERNYHPCDFSRPVLLLVYGSNPAHLEQLNPYLNAHIRLHRIENLEKINTDAILYQLDSLSSQYYDNKNDPVIFK
ncbi:hypothetical protein [Legionella taurinensis]|uniref:Uncharacterized protein n=1 Tax=Legionella taurinensis TaxID=70611 RepID=A0A3A5L464_9GAMM|nr:hypothetical protein [Legionella taurinensis]RJT43912.1 hypothetical protein D6J04_13555 [Legionella taurinensis]RJT65299.1 hypothetical protein D6J03_12995 [Legionella taurinensis]STY26202.1 Uncharacterised protein [Legionella taurinensis]